MVGVVGELCMVGELMGQLLELLEDDEHKRIDMVRVVKTDIEIWICKTLQEFARVCTLKSRSSIELVERGEA